MAGVKVQGARQGPGGDSVGMSTGSAHSEGQPGGAATCTGPLSCGPQVDPCLLCPLQASGHDGSSWLSYPDWDRRAEHRAPAHMRGLHRARRQRLPQLSHGFPGVMTQERRCARLVCPGTWKASEAQQGTGRDLRESHSLGPGGELKS